MNANTFDIAPRLFLPRWLPSDQLQGGLTKADQRDVPSVISDTFDIHQKDWITEKSLSSAEALVAYAISTNRPLESSLRRAALFIIDRSPNSLIAKQAREIIGGSSKLDTDPNVFKMLAKARRIVRRYPDSSLIWSDLAYYHCLTGNRESARISAMTAEKVAIGTPSETVPIARCMVHLDDPEFGLRTLRKTLKSHLSPIAIGSEMAICQIIGIPSKYSRDANRLAASSNLSPQDEALIKAAVATDLVISGSERKAKKLLAGGTLIPDENTLAQLVWLSDRLGLEIDPSSSGVDKAYEAIGRAAYQDRDYKACIKATELWSEFQPFSVTAISFGSYVAGFLIADHERSLKLLERGQVVGQTSFSIWNNSAFDYAKLDRLPEASKALQHAAKNADSEHDRNILSATRGLIMIRSGEVSAGEETYRTAIRGFMSKRDLRSASIASVMCAEELARLGRLEAITLIDEANSLASEGNHVRVLEAIHGIRKKALKGFGL